MSTEYLIPGLSTSIGAVIITLYVSYKLWIENRSLTSQLNRMTKLRLEERKGRTNAEKLLRNKPQPMTTSNSTIIKYVNLRIIGTFHSPFNDRRGTPRQGVLVPSAIGYIELHPWIQPQSTLDGLIQNFSHICCGNPPILCNILMI
eukprot:204702_1